MAARNRSYGTNFTGNNYEKTRLDSILSRTNDGILRRDVGQAEGNIDGYTFFSLQDDTT